MPRAPRLQDAGYVHHVISRGNDRQPLFKSSKDYQRYLFHLDESRKKYPIKIYNYVLMENHIHLLVEPKADGSLSKVMEDTSKAYAKYFNKKYGRVGHVFQGRFKSFLVQQERYFFACSRYIDLNPVKAGVVSEPKDYIWSGYSDLATGKRGHIDLDQSEVFLSLGKSDFEREIAYRTLVMSYQGQELDLLNKRAGVLGDKEFKKRFKS